MASVLKPENAAGVLDAVAWAAAGETPLEVVGRGSRRALGRPFQSETVLDLSSLTGIVDYQPEELVLSVLPATPMAEIEKLLAAHNQMLAFEPQDLTGLLGAARSEGSIGGTFLTNASGPRRIKAGAARDHLLGFEAVSGRAEAFKSGAKVVKNVTGYDLSKLICGSYGTLAAVTRLDLKVMPLPEATSTILVFGPDAKAGIAAMSAAMNSAHEVSGAAYLPADAARLSAVGAVSRSGGPVCALRVEGFGPSVARRTADLKSELAGFGEVGELDTLHSRSFWGEVRDAHYLVAPMDSIVWRLSVPPASGAEVAAQLLRIDGARWFADWAGGLIWLQVPASVDAGEAEVRAAVAASGGHATLVRAPVELRAAVPVFQPQPEALARLAARVKDSFDPKRVLNPGRMVAGV